MARARRIRVVEQAPPPDICDLPLEAAGSETRSMLRIAIVGLSPLLTHSAIAMLAPKQARGSVIPTPQEEAEAGTYRDAEGNCCIPGVAVQRTLLEAAAAFRSPKGRLSMQSFLAHCEVQEELLQLLDPVTRLPLRTYEIDTRTAVVQRNRILRSRPRFNHWAIGRITMTYDPQLIANPTIIPDIVADAGTRRGIGDNRPGKSKGPFGRFAIVATSYGEFGPWQRYVPGAAPERVEDPEAEEE